MEPENTAENADKLAREFIDQLRSDLTDEQMDEIAARNKAEQNPNVCHSHDFTDANEYMHDAWVEVFPGIEWHEIDQCNALWGAAWELAKSWGFQCPN